MFFMRYPIDVLFLDREGVVLAQRRSRPGGCRAGIGAPTACWNCAAGTLERDENARGRPDPVQINLIMATSSTKGAANRKSITDILVSRKLLTEQQLQPALDEAQRSDKPLQQVVVDKKLLEKNTVLKALSEEWRIKAVNLTDIEVDLDVVKVIPETTARRHKAVPFAKEENVLFVAMSDPRDFFAVEDIQLRTGFEVQPYLALPSDVGSLLDKAYGTTTTTAEVSVEDIIKGVTAGSDGSTR